MKKIIAYIWIFIISFLMLLPLALTFVYSFSKSWDSILPKGFTLEYYGIIFQDFGFLVALGRGFAISFFPILIMNLVVILALYYSMIESNGLESVIQILCMLPYSIQGVILSTSVLALYAGSHTFISNRIFLLSLTYCIIILPYIFQAIRNSFYAVNLKNLVEAGEMLGATRFQILLRIIIPSLKSGILVSTLLSIALIFGDFSIIKIIAGNQYQTAQMYLHNTRNMPTQIASAIVVIMFFITFLISNTILAIKGDDPSSHAKGE